MATDTNTKADSPRKENRTLYWVLFALSLVTIIVSGASLAQRIEQYNIDSDRPLFAFVQVNSTSFEYAGREFSITPINNSTPSSDDDADPKKIAEHLLIKFGEQELLLDVAIEPQVPLPTLYETHKDWLTVVLFADRSGMSMRSFEEKIANDEILPRLGIVTRTPFGIEPAKAPRFDNIAHEENLSTGDTHRERWRFDCYEFLRDGSILHEVKRFPESGKSLLRRRNNAKLKGEAIPQRRADELSEYTWQYGAALKTMPRAPAITQENQALLVAGWTLPVTAAAFLVMLCSFFFAIAPPRTTEESISKP